MFRNALFKGMNKTGVKSNEKEDKSQKSGFRLGLGSNTRFIQMIDEQFRIENEIFKNIVSKRRRRGAFARVRTSIKDVEDSDAPVMKVLQNDDLAREIRSYL